MLDKMTKPRQAYVGPPFLIGVAALFCLGFAAIGFIDLLASLIPFTWQSVPCSILDFKPTDDPNAALPFSAEVRYEFEWHGSQHTSNRLGIAGWKHASTPLEMAQRLQTNPQTVCYIPDDNPNHTALVRPPAKWGSLSFIGFGLCMTWILVKAHRERNSPTISQKMLVPCMVFFGGAGIFLLLGLSVPVWLGWLQSRTWHQVPATVMWSKMRTRQGAKHRTHYSPDICYAYQADGKSWRSNTTAPGHLEIGSNSNDARKLLDQYPVGTHTTCWVNPNKPYQSMLRRDIGWKAILTLFPLPFCAVGVICAISLLPKKRSSPAKPTNHR